MEIHRTMVTGRNYPLLAQGPENSLEQFYRAFNERDLSLMACNWQASEEISMCNPLGGMLRGWDEIEGLYRSIFSGLSRVQVAFYDYSLQTFPGGFLVVGREHATVVRNGETMQLKIRTSRVFRLQEGGWRQWHHHGSLEDPDCLARYQQWIAATPPKEVSDNRSRA